MRGPGLPQNGEEERDRLTRTPLVVLQADYRRALERERILESQLAHVRRRITRLADELHARALEAATLRRTADPFNPYDAPGYY